MRFPIALRWVPNKSERCYSLAGLWKRSWAWRVDKYSETIARTATASCSVSPRLGGRVTPRAGLRVAAFGCVRSAQFVAVCCCDRGSGGAAAAARTACK